MTDEHDVASSWRHNVNGYVVKSNMAIDFFNLKDWKREGRESREGKLYADKFVERDWVQP